MRSSCDTLRQRILKNMTTSDFNNMSVQLKRLGGVDWGHVEPMDAAMTFSADPMWDPTTSKQRERAHESDFVNKPNVFLARIELTYEIPKE